MIKAVIFDYGGVVISGGGGNEPVESLSAFLDIPKEEAASIIASLWGKYVTGELSEAQYWKEVEKLYGRLITKNTQETRSTWEAVRPLSEIITFIEHLRSKEYIVGLLSNITASTEAVIRSGGGYDLFNPCILSCKVGYAKPSLEIYKLLLEQLPGIQPHEIVFIDDQQRYLDPAHMLGLQTILATSSSQLTRDVKLLL